MRTGRTALRIFIRAHIFRGRIAPAAASAASPLEDKPRFLFAACNIYGGAGIFSQSFEEESGMLNIQISPDISRCDGDEFYIYLPNGYDAPDMKAEEKMRTAHGRIFALKAEAPGMRIKTVKKQ